MSWESIESGCIYLLLLPRAFNPHPERFLFLDKKNPARMSWKSKNQGASTITLSRCPQSPSGHFGFPLKEDFR